MREATAAGPGGRPKVVEVCENALVESLAKVLVPWESA